MQPAHNRFNFMKKISLHAMKFSALYLLVGIGLISISNMDWILFLPNHWTNLFVLTDAIGDTFVALALATFIYSFIVLLCRKYEKKFAETRPLNTHILATFRKGLRLIYLLAALHLSISIIGPNKHYLSYANNLINIIIIISIGWTAIQILHTIEAVVYQYMMRLTKTDHLRVKAIYTKLHIIRNITSVVIAIITIAAILMSFSSVRNIGISLLASAGFFTAIIGLAAQKGLFSLFSGLQIALAQPIKIGDMVVVENVSGIIEEITFTYVTLKLGDKRRLVVPINYFVEKPFENWSREGMSLRSSLHFYVDYLIPIDPLRKELNTILQQSAFWDGHAGKLQVSNLSERSVEIRIQVSAENADKLSDLRAETREKMLEFIRLNFPDHFPKVRNATQNDTPALLNQVVTEKFSASELPA